MDPFVQYAGGHKARPYAWKQWKMKYNIFKTPKIADFNE
jgi:hypothetical protein